MREIGYTVGRLATSSIRCGQSSLVHLGCQVDVGAESARPEPSSSTHHPKVLH
jgi:hypothetical protein